MLSCYVGHIIIICILSPTPGPIMHARATVHFQDEFPHHTEQTHPWRSCEERSLHNAVSVPTQHLMNIHDAVVTACVKGVPAKCGLSFS